MESVDARVHGEKEALLTLLTAFLRPLMPVALEFGVSAKDVSDAVRRAYVHALETRMGSQDRPLSDARLALVAGLTRSEVALCRERSGSNSVTSARQREQYERVGVILSVWNTHSKFSGAYGLALDLDLEPTAGSPRRSFEELVRVACPGSSPDEVLDELLAVGAVEVVNNTTVRCRSRTALLNDSAVTNRINRSARFLEAVAQTFAHNIHSETSSDPYFERVVVSDHPLTERTRTEFAKVVRDRGETFVTGLDTWLSKLDEPNESSGAKYYGAAVFFFEESVASRASSPASAGGAQLENNAREIDVLSYSSRKS